MYRSASNKTGKDPCEHSHSDTIAASVCSWRRKYDFIMEIDSRGKTAKVLPRMSRAEWKSARVQRSGERAPAKRAASAATPTRSKERVAPRATQRGKIGIGPGGNEPTSRKEARVRRAAGEIERPVLESDGLEHDERCKYWVGERTLITTGAPLIVRASFVPPKMREPKWFKGPIKGPFYSIGSGSQGIEVYEYDPASRISPEDARTYRNARSCPCCGAMYERDAAGNRTREAGCWYCGTYHLAPFVGTDSYKSWAVINRPIGLLRCPSYRKSHAHAIERAEPGPDRDEAQSTHAFFAALPFAHRNEWPELRELRYEAHNAREWGEKLPEYPEVYRHGLAERILEQVLHQKPETQTPAAPVSKRKKPAREKPLSLPLEIETAVIAAEVTEAMIADDGTPPDPTDVELAALGDAVVVAIKDARERENARKRGKQNSIAPEPAAPIAASPDSMCVRASAASTQCVTHKGWLGTSERRCDAAPANLPALAPPATGRQAVVDVKTATRNVAPVGEDVVPRDPRIDCEASPRCSFRASHRCPGCGSAICNGHARTQTDNPKLPRKCGKCAVTFKGAALVTKTA